MLPEYRGHGIGLALMTHLARIAVERGCGRFEWSVLDWNEPAIGFYRGLGANLMDGWSIVRITGDALTKLASASGASSARRNGRPDGLHHIRAHIRGAFTLAIAAASVSYASNTASSRMITKTSFSFWVRLAQLQVPAMVGGRHVTRGQRGDAGRIDRGTSCMLRITVRAPLVEREADRLTQRGSVWPATTARAVRES